MNNKPRGDSRTARERDPVLPKLPMTNWYSPRILVATALRVAVSTVFGQFADRREGIAAANAIEPQPFDDSLAYEAGAGTFWFDYLADTGDGWNRHMRWRGLSRRTRSLLT